MTASSSFRQLIDSLPQQAVQQAIAAAYKEVDRADRELQTLASEMTGGSSDISDSQRGKNYNLNRYSDVVPYNRNRVRLHGTSDYINASHITLPAQLSTNRYIATQGPLPHSVGDFWRMVWEQDAKAIVMLTNTVEALRSKCAEYWPVQVGEEKKWGDMAVRLEDERPMLGCLSVVVRRISVAAKGVERRVTQFHYTEWPDHGVPRSPVPLLRIIDELRKNVSPSSESPVVVHCSAGVGRTGTFVIIDAAKGYFEKHQDYQGDYVADAFRSLRSQRTLMVQTLAQYMMCYQVINYILNSAS
ncbi:Tyrosine-protein phosphatase non-receptor type 3 [Coemansia interrupta]|uniref:Tyrosine-protein phosphatase non-receptor type 3 n=1 Tax=Coemansia interrupta TaxID=1126814 RepID=A0A9W8H9U9_9FUNG|nr:Tyrosine-protein phosphatase non-receptor type 3 [Coemansia interrupta]